MPRPCFHQQPLTRRKLLERCANGFGALALSALMNEPAYAALRHRPLLPILSSPAVGTIRRGRPLTQETTQCSRSTAGPTAIATA